MWRGAATQFWVEQAGGEAGRFGVSRDGSGWRKRRAERCTQSPEGRTGCRAATWPSWSRALVHTGRREGAGRASVYVRRPEWSPRAVRPCRVRLLTCEVPHDASPGQAVLLWPWGGSRGCGESRTRNTRSPPQVRQRRACSDAGRGDGRCWGGGLGGTRSWLERVARRLRIGGSPVRRRGLKRP